jgi:serine/threonine protein kinase
LIYFIYICRYPVVLRRTPFYPKMPLVKKDEMIASMVSHFNKNDIDYFVSKQEGNERNNKNYNGVLNCLLKKDVVKIYDNVKANILSEARENGNVKPLSSKDDYVLILTKHFSEKDLVYFTQHIKLSEIDYNKYFKCLPLKDIKKLYKVVEKDFKKLPNEVINEVVVVAKPVVVAAKPVKKPVAKKKSLEYLPFDTVRVAENFEKKVNDIYNNNLRSKANILKSVMIMSQLFKNDVISMGMKVLKNIIKVEITGVLSLRPTTLVYIGKIIESPKAIDVGKMVVVKVQPRAPDMYKRDDVERKKYFRPDVPFQILTEYHIMNKLQKSCSKVPMAKIYEYGAVSPLIEGDIERYVLVTELLGRDLTKLKGKSVENIKSMMILTLNALRLLHNCNIVKKESYIHKDIKPENIVFGDSKEDTVKLIDFGTTANIYKYDGVRNMVPAPSEGTNYYMSTMKHKKSIDDYMDDLQSFVWSILDVLGDKEISTGMPWYGNNNDEIYNKKMEFIEKCKDPEYVTGIANGTLTPNNIAIIGELAGYTIGRADKPNSYPTDLKTAGGLYYSEFNEKYYSDMSALIKMLS